MTGFGKFFFNSLRYFGQPNEIDLRNAHFILNCPDDTSAPQFMKIAYILLEHQFQTLLLAIDRMYLLRKLMEVEIFNGQSRTEHPMKMIGDGTFMKDQIIA